MFFLLQSPPSQQNCKGRGVPKCSRNTNLIFHLVKSGNKDLTALLSHYYE